MREYAIVAAGLVIGLMARWAVVLSLGQPLGWKVIRVDLLVIGMNGLLALLFGETLNLAGVKLAVEAAMCGASSTILFSAMQNKWIKQNLGPQMIFTGQNEAICLPPNPRAVEVHTVGDTTPQNVRDLTMAVLKHIKSVPGDPFASILDKLDKPD